MLFCGHYSDIRAKLFFSLTNHDPNFHGSDDHNKFLYLMTCNSGDGIVTNAVLNYVEQAFTLHAKGCGMHMINSPIILIFSLSGCNLFRYNTT